MSNSEEQGLRSRPLTFSGSSLPGDLGRQAASTMEALWDKDLHTFWRSTEHRARNSAKKIDPMFFPTVTYRCTESLMDAAKNNPEWLSPNAQEALVLHVRAVFEHGLEESDSSLDTTKEAGIQNPFTTSLYANALAKAYLHRNTFLASLDHSDVVAKAKTAVKSMDSSCGITEPDAGAQVHPFIQYHALRAVLTLSLILENG